MNDIWPDGGRVSWYENNGNLDDTSHWKRRYIGKSPAMHRLKGNYSGDSILYVSLKITGAVGHFTRTDKVQIVAAPIIIKSADLTSPAPIIIYTAPDDPASLPVDDDGQGWPLDVPFPQTFHLVHEVFSESRQLHFPLHQKLTMCFIRSFQTREQLGSNSSRRAGRHFSHLV